jgi:hypothetical protein
MAQNPFKVDQLQIEPGASGTRLINKATDGSLQFLDAVITGGLTLKQLAGLRNVANVLIVGLSGAGAAYTTIQSALDAVPSTSSALNPYFVLVGPGVYSETINIVRDGVTIIGFGAVINAEELVADGPGAYHTVVMQASLGTIPRSATLINLEIGNIHQNYACLRIVGASGSNVGRSGIRLQNCCFKATSATGNKPIWATSANFITLEGGSMACHASALTLVEECASFLMKGVSRSSALQLDWDSTGTLPSGTVESYALSGCSEVGYGTSLSPILASTLSGGSALAVSGCTGNITGTFSGDRTVTITGSDMGAFSIASTVAVQLSGSSRGAIIAGGTATVEESIQRGTAAFVGDTTKAVAFEAPHPNTNYSITLTTDARPANDEVMWVTSKAVTGFTINFVTAQTLGVSWSVVRN